MLAPVIILDEFENGFSAGVTVLGEGGQAILSLLSSERRPPPRPMSGITDCHLYTSDAAEETQSSLVGGMSQQAVVLRFAVPECWRP